LACLYSSCPSVRISPRFAFAEVDLSLDYVVQGHRYNVYEDLGPLIATYDVVLAYPLFYVIDPIICIIEAVFAVLTIRTLLTHRKEMDSALSIGSSNVNKNHFVRLVCLSAIAVLLHLSLSLWVLMSNAIDYQVHPWISWEDTHSDYGRIAYISRFLMQQSQESVISMSVMLFATTLCAFNYFFLFGFGEEAMKHYRSFIGAIVRPFGIKYPRKEERTMVERTRQGAMFGRLGKAANPPTPTPSMRHLDPNTPTLYRPGRSNSLFSQATTTTRTGDDDLYIDMTNLDFQKGRTGLTSFDSTAEQSTCKYDHRRDSTIAGESWDITNQRGSEKLEVTNEPSVSTRGGDNDLEAQQPRRSEGQDAQRKAILEKDLELTEEVTF
jgi:Pheromone A receptor